MQSFDLTQGDSYTIGIRFDTRYDIADLQELKVYCFGMTFTPVVTTDPRVYRIEIESDTTLTIEQGFYPLEVSVDDINIGVKKVQAAVALVKKSLSSYNNNSINIGYNLMIDLMVNYQVNVSTLLVNLVKGDKGDPGLSGGAAVVNHPVVGTINGSNATFTSMVAFNPDSLVVYLNGQRLYVVNDYITTGTNTIIFNEAPLIGDMISIDIF